MVIDNELTLKLPEVINIQIFPMISVHYLVRGNKNTQTHHAEVLNLIKHQIVVTNLQGNVNQLFGVNG